MNKNRKELRRLGIAIIDAANFALKASKWGDKILFDYWNSEANRLIQQRNSLVKEACSINS